MAPTPAVGSASGIATYVVSHYPSRSLGRVRQGLIVFATAILIVTALSLGLHIPIQRDDRSLFHPALDAASSTTIREFQGPFPRKVWQTWTVSPPAFAQRDMAVARTWTDQNPEWRWEVLTDSNQLGFVEQHFGPHGLNRLDIVDFFTNLQTKIIKADLLRYLIMYVEGGLYADIDVEALKPMHEFIPTHFNEADIDMVIGIEADEPKFKDHPILGLTSRSFCQWTFICKPRLPFMLGMVEAAMAKINDLAKEQGVPVSQVKVDFDEVIGSSGPGVFTNVIMEYMNENRTQQSLVTWDNFHHMDKARLVSRILVLPVKAFAAAQTHSRSGKTHNVSEALVKHHYGASNWTSRHSRYKNPVYGEVEACRFNETCVKQWDKNVAAYNALHDDEQSH